MIKNRRARLLVPLPILKRLKEEVLYLNLDGKVRLTHSEESPQSRGDLLRRIVFAYIDWCEIGNSWEVDPDQKTGVLSYYFLRLEMGRWDYAVKSHFATSYHHLASLSLDWWFRRMDGQTLRDRDTWAALMTCPLDQFRDTLNDHP